MTIKVGPCGGDGGKPFSMDNTDNITRIVKIRVASSTDRIEAITIIYLVDGDDVAKSVTWGKAAGVWQDFELQTGEYILSVTGKYGAANNIDCWCGVRGLTFQTTFGPRGPYGNYHLGNDFELPAINGRIIGFHGRSDTHLDALGVHIKVGVPH